jgi:hypothetical protein
MKKKLFEKLYKNKNSPKSFFLVVLFSFVALSSFIVWLYFLFQENLIYETYISFMAWVGSMGALWLIYKNLDDKQKKII